jgi:hypothetical protein
MRPAAARTSFGLAHLIVLAIFVQAVLAGLFLFGQPALVHAHRYLGDLLVALAVAFLVAVLLARFDPASGLAPLAVVLLVFTGGQYALGLLGRASPLAAALHVPNAFIMFTAAMLWLTRARRALRECG